MVRKEDVREAWVSEHASIEFWLSRIRPVTRRNYRDFAHYFFAEWLPSQGGPLADKSPEEILDFQEGAEGRRDRYLVLDSLHKCVDVRGGRRKTKLNRISIIRSYFKHSRVELPSDPSFRVNGDHPPVTGRLTVDALRKIMLAATRLYRAIFSIMFMAAMGEEEFIYFNNHWPTVKEQLRRREIIKIDLPGRKHARNARPYYTFIGGDGVTWLKEYLTRERGPIKPGDPIFINDRGNPVTKMNIRRAFTRFAAKAGLIKIATPDCPQCGGETVKRRTWHEDKTKTVYRCLKCNVQSFASQVQRKMEVRYGVNPHEMRDLFRSEWELSPARVVCAEFFLGHEIDPNEYNKIMKLHPDWAEKQYRLAEPYLNILSEEPRKISLGSVQELQEKIKKLEAKAKISEEAIKRLEELENFVKKKRL